MCGALDRLFLAVNCSNFYPVCVFIVPMVFEAGLGCTLYIYPELCVENAPSKNETASNAGLSEKLYVCEGSVKLGKKNPELVKAK